MSKNIATPLLGSSSLLTLKLDSDVLIIVSVAVNHKHLDTTVYLYMYREVIHIFLSEDYMFGDA
jgi:hypothetical protein